MRAQRTLGALVLSCIVGATVAAAHHGTSRALSLELPPLYGPLLALVALAALVALVWPVRDQRAARRLDQAHQTSDAVQNAIEFAALAPAARTPFMQAHLRDAQRRAGALSAARAAPLRLPRAWRWVSLPCIAWLAALLVHPEAPKSTPQRETVARAKLLHDDEVAAFSEELRAYLSASTLTEAAQEQANLYNELLERVATGELSRAEALRALLTLERKLLQADAPAGEQDARFFRELAEDLARVDEALARSLSSQEPQAASEALRKRAEALGSAAAEERARLADALAKQRERERARAGREAREKELESLLKRREEQSASAPGERSLFERQRRELERLRRERAAERQRNRELSRLSRDLSRGADALESGAVSEAQQALNDAAQDLERFARQQLGGEQQRELAKQVAQLREQLQRSRPGGGADQARSQPGASARERQTERFMLRARGAEGQGSEARLSLQRGQPGKPGSGSGGQGEPQPGSGTPAQRQGETRVLTPGGADQDGVELIVPGQRLSRAASAGAGQEHDPRTLAKPTDLSGKHQDSQLSGEAGRGPTRSEVILDAADRGFATTSYQRVYSDYRAHAEDVIERDEVPPGYRFYVRRYFQLIRPRDE
jgi:hypothetical protein